ncbi:MAG: hypothetical protein JNL82_00345 [Myxococcales bacterium]|nr:hypothetical protein [Myxococcales bacterium]
MKIAGIVTTVIALILVGLWLAFVRAPAPEEVCAHKSAIALAETRGEYAAAAENLIDRINADCVKERRKLLQLRGKIAYARQAKCILAATTLSEAERCG